MGSTAPSLKSLHSGNPRGGTGEAAAGPTRAAPGGGGGGARGRPQAEAWTHTAEWTGGPGPEQLNSLDVGNPDQGQRDSQDWSPAAFCSIMH